MDERDKDLTHLFVRDLDEIPLPPRGAWRRPQGRETTTMRASRLLLTAGAVVAVLAIALIVGFQLRDRNSTAANPSASPTPSASGATVVAPSASATAIASATSSPASTAATSAPGGVYNDDFGFIVAPASDSAAVAIRTESSNTRVASFDQQGFAVSPDGTRIAYWTAGSSSAPSQLRVVSAASPNSLLFSSTLSANEHGGAIVWSSDRDGLLYAINTGDPTPGTVGSATTGSVVRSLDLRAGGPGTVLITSTKAGAILQPIAWDRARGVIVAGVTGEGGFMSDYIVASSATPQAPAKRTPVTGQVTIGSVRASTDAKFVVGTDIDTGFGYWPLADISAKVVPAESKYWRTGALWRPGTHEIGFIGPSNQFWLCNVDRNTPLGCGATAFSGVPAGAFVRMFRADGAAVVLEVPTGAGFGQANYTLVKFTNDPLAAKATGGERVTFTDLGGLAASGLAASVRFR